MNVTDKDIKVFSYSKDLKEFDTLISDSLVTNINRLLLRARFNSHRKVIVYALKLNDIEMKEFNNRINSLESHSDLFIELENKGIKEIPW